jgi:hypothetical protein
MCFVDLGLAGFVGCGVARCDHKLRCPAKLMKGFGLADERISQLAFYGESAMHE